MKHTFYNSFQWLSKHYKFIVFALTGLSFVFFTFVYPILLRSVIVPVWLLFILLFMPFLLAKIYTFYYLKSMFKIGDTVLIKGSSTTYFVIGYAFLNKRVLKIRHFHREPIFYHESFLTLL